MSLVIKKKAHTAKFFGEKLGEGVTLDMMLIPGGTFQMGSPADEIDRFSDESPQHWVTVPTFCMGKYPITQEQWRVVANLPAVNQELSPDPSNFKGDNRPVEQVSWFDAQEFCARLNIVAKRDYRLPSEAEWEYACRAETTSPFHFGKTITTDLANYDGTDDPDGEWSGFYGRGPKGIYRQETTAVDTFSPNVFGLYDMHGNVWEWCLDHYHSDYEGAPIDGSAWINPNAEQNAFRGLRGGSWNSNPHYCRSACRYDYGNPDNLNWLLNVGFRVVCEAARTP
jgi:formylglycine-generating enzyme required for sulfatase activity